MEFKLFHCSLASASADCDRARRSSLLAEMAYFTNLTTQSPQRQMRSADKELSWNLNSIVPQRRSAKKLTSQYLLPLLRVLILLRGSGSELPQSSARLQGPPRYGCSGQPALLRYSHAKSIYLQIMIRIQKKCNRPTAIVLRKVHALA